MSNRKRSRRRSPKRARAPNRAIETTDEPADEPGRLGGAASVIAEAIESGVLDRHLLPITEAVHRRLDGLLREAEANAAAGINVGDRVRLGPLVEPKHLTGATAVVTGWDHRSVLVRLDRPVGRYSTDVDIRMSPLGLCPIAA